MQPTVFSQFQAAINRLSDNERDVWACARQMQAAGLDGVARNLYDIAAGITETRREMQRIREAWVGEIVDGIRQGEKAMAETVLGLIERLVLPPGPAKED